MKPASALRRSMLMADGWSVIWTHHFDVTNSTSAFKEQAFIEATPTHLLSGHLMRASHWRPTLRIVESDSQSRANILMEIFSLSCNGRLFFTTIQMKNQRHYLWSIMLVITAHQPPLAQSCNIWTTSFPCFHLYLLRLKPCWVRGVAL
jgi:hypothetical protein